MSTGSNPHARRRAAGVARARRGPRRTRVKPARARGPATAVLPRADRPLPSPRRLAVGPEDVVPVERVEALDRGLAVEAAVWSSSIVEIEPPGERPAAFVAGA